MIFEELRKDTLTRMNKSIDSLRADLATVRTGRASASLFEHITIDYHGTPTPLQHTASISIPEARLVIISPWDASLLSLIEKAIIQSDLSLNPQNDGKVIRIAVPPLTDERRQEMAKTLRQHAEEARVSIRNIRRSTNDELKKSEKTHEISEDDLKHHEKDIQALTDNAMKTIQDIADAKEKEILEE